MGTWKFAVIGGDLRQARLAQCLLRDGHSVCLWGIDPQDLPDGITPCADLGHALEDTDCVILPLPAATADGLISTPLSGSRLMPGELFARIPRGALCFGGRISPSLWAAAREAGIDLTDYFDREELTVLNAIPTAEGAIQIAMEKLPITLHGSRCLVIGHGRIGRVLSAMLRGLGAQVTVSARRWEDLAWIRAEGHTPARTGELREILPRFDVVFNTVPARLLEEPLLRKLRPDALCIDLASAPGGIDQAAAARLGRHCLRALSLPGKVAPYTSGEIVYHTVMNLLQEKRSFPHET